MSIVTRQAGKPCRREQTWCGMIDSAAAHWNLQHSPSLFSLHFPLYPAISLFLPLRISNLAEISPDPAHHKETEFCLEIL